MAVATACALMVCSTAFAGAECYGWGETRGIRIDGALVEFRAGLVAARPGWQLIAPAGHWRTRDPQYRRDDDGAYCSGQLAFRDGGELSFKQTVLNVGTGAIRIDVEVTASSDQELDGVYYFVRVPSSDFSEGTAQLLGASPPADSPVTLATTRPASDKHYVGGQATGARFQAADRQVQLSVDRPREMCIQDDRDTGEETISLFFPIGTGRMAKGQVLRDTIAITAAVAPQTHPATITLDPAQRGGTFAGVGGNFVYQTQSPAVGYYLDNLALVWGRCAMPLDRWQPREEIDPSALPDEKLPDEVREAMRMAGELHRRNIPTIITVWDAPGWVHATRAGDEAQTSEKRPIDPDKWEAVTRSICAYLVRLKRMNGAEPAMFSFNEANLGINVLLSAEEQRDAMKRLGAAFASAGLKTRMLLGDANAPIHVTYVDAALADPEAMRYVSGISFHSWNQFTDEHLAGWRARAVSAGVPLFVGEGGTDPDSYHYPDVCLEPWFALDEAVMYLRCLSVAQPLSMLHWELTANYGLGRPTRDGTFEPAMRWWQYKQISQLTPPNSAVIAARSDDRQLTVAALSGRGQSVGALHIANTGAQRTVMIRGFAPDARTMKCHITDAARGMEELPAVNIVGGEATMVIPTQCLLTLSAPTP